MPTRFRKLLRAVGAAFALILVLMMLVPWLFKDRIMAELKQAANAQLNAEVDFSDVRISLFRHFPDLRVCLYGLHITGKGPFAGIPLAQIEALDLRVDLLSVLSSSRPLTIERVSLTRPEAYILILSDGQANYDITLPDTSGATATTPFVVDLHRYEIRQGRVRYEDRQSNLLVEVAGLTHNGRGRFTESVFDLHTQTRIDSLTVVSGGIAWLDEARMRFDATLGIDLNRMHFEIKDNQLAINALELSTEGWVALPDEGIDMDLSVQAADNAFADLFSLVPGAFVEGYERVQAGGTFRLTASAQGRYAADAWPAFELELSARDGSIRYPDMPLGIEQVRAQMHLAHPGGPPDLLIIDLRELALQVGHSDLSAKFSLRTPLSDPDLDAHLDARLDLAEWAQAFPLKGIQTLQGTFSGRLMARARLSQLEKGAYDQVQMDGSFALRNFAYARADMPRIAIPFLSGRLQPDALRITQFESRLGRSDLRGSATLRHLLGWFAEGRQMSGQLRLQSTTFDLDEWLTPSEEEEATVPAPLAGTNASARAAPMESWRLDYELHFDRLLYEPYELRALTAAGSLTPQRLDIRTARGRLGASEFALSGTLTNLENFATYNETLNGRLKLESPFMDYADLMPAAEPQEPQAATPPDPMPNLHYDIRFEGRIRRFSYAPYKLEDLRIAGRLTEDTIAIDHFSTHIGRSDLAGNGTIRNYLEYVYLDEPIKGNLVLEADLLDADELVAAEEGEPGTAAESSGAYEVPSAFEFDILARADQLVYSGIPLRNVSGKLAMAEGTLWFEDFRADALGGQMALSGRYSTTDPKRPAFAIKYELKNLLFQEAFRKMVSFRALAPIAQFVEGRFHSSVIVEGILDPNMLPQLHTIDAQGFLKTADALIKGFPPLEQLSRRIDLPFFRQIPLEAVEAWFEIQDGTVEIKPIDYTWQDIQMNIRGSHRLDGLMDYQIVALIPRDRFASNPVGAQAAAGADWLQQQAAALGLPLEAGEFVKLRIALRGTIQKPDISVKLLGFEGAPIVEKAKEAAQARAEQMIEEKRAEVVAEAQAQRDSLAQRLREETAQITDSLKTQVEKKAEETVEEVKKKAGEEVGKKVEEIMGQEAKKEMNQIRDKLEKWNPFGKKDKKKKEGGN